jgi:hypothetical protein
MFSGLKRWWAAGKKLRILKRLQQEALIALQAGEGFGVPVEMIGTADDIQYFIEQLTNLAGDHIRASVWSGMCFVYPDGAESAPTQFTMMGIKR